MSKLLINKHKQERINALDMASTLSNAISKGVLDGSDDSVIFYDLSRLNKLIDNLKNAFPNTTLHAIAVKANPLIGILKIIGKAGLGVEVASIGEIQLAVAAGFPAKAIVFDSPAKTIQELAIALEMGIRINANCLGELKRINGLYSNLNSRSNVGIRINPEIGKGSIESTSVAVSNSKFGISLKEHRTDIIDAFCKYPWLTGLHMHIGSQGMSFDQLMKGVGEVYDFFLELKKRKQVNIFNIGGGLPVQYKETDVPTHFDTYAKELRKLFPVLFEPSISIATEFGRSVHANCGWVASKIEYVIQHGDSSSTLIIHVGADMFLRKAYCPNDWHHDISVCDPTGRLRTGPSRMYSVAGPLCFAGDYLGHNVSLPATVREGDYILIHDAGAYTYGMWSMYNSRQFPKAIGYEGERYNFKCLRPHQPVDEIVNFWSMGAEK